MLFVFFLFEPFGLQIRLFQEKYPLPSPRRMGFGRFSWGGGGGAFSTGGGAFGVFFSLQKPFRFLFGTNLHTGNVWMDGWMDGWIHKHTYKTVHAKQLGRSWG